MSDLYSVRITPQAQQDIREILSYISDELMNPQAAKHHEDTFRDAIVGLSEEPKRYRRIREQPWGHEGVRKINALNYYIYFWIDDVSRTVYITAVIYAARDQQRQLEERNVLGHD